MAELWVIRHFRTPWNAEGRLQGRRDIALTEPLVDDDRRQLEANVQALAGTAFAEVLTSPLARARRTAALHGHADARPCPDLAELDFGRWEGRRWLDLEAAHPGGWAQAPQTLPLGESFGDFLARIQRVLDHAAASPGPVLAFGHGGWMGALQSLLAGEAGQSLAQYPAHNGLLLRVPL